MSITVVGLLLTLLTKCFQCCCPNRCCRAKTCARLCCVDEEWLGCGCFGDDDDEEDKKKKDKCKYEGDRHEVNVVVQMPPQVAPPVPLQVPVVVAKSNGRDNEGNGADSYIILAYD